MKTTAFIVGIVGLLALGSCTNETTCIARASDGTMLYEVEGSDSCDDQINSAQGEYCDCNDKN